MTYLNDLGRHPPEPAAEFASLVVRSARWQRAARPYLLAIGALALSVAEGTRLAAGVRQ
jgi:hypothetical protein